MPIGPLLAKNGQGDVHATPAELYSVGAGVALSNVKRPSDEVDGGRVSDRFERKRADVPVVRRVDK